MKSKRPSDWKTSFLEVHIEIRFLIYDALFDDIEARLTELSKTPSVNIEFTSLPQDAIMAIRRTSRQMQQEIDKWLVSKPSMKWSPNFGFFAPDLTSWKLEITWYGLYPSGFRKHGHRCKEILANKRKHSYNSANLRTATQCEICISSLLGLNQGFGNASRKSLEESGSCAILRL